MGKSVLERRAQKMFVRMLFEPKNGLCGPVSWISGTRSWLLAFWIKMKPLARLCLLALAAMNPLLDAGQIMTYVISGTATGFVQPADGSSTNAFSNVALTITGTADVDTLDQSPAFGFNEIDFEPGAARLTISGLGSATFSNLVFAVDNYRNGALVFGGLFTPTSGDIVELTDSDLGSNVFSTYFLDTPLGPVGPATDEAVASWNNIPTSLGSVTVTSYNDVTFSATAVPEPGYFLTIFFVLALLILFRRTSSGLTTPFNHAVD